MVTTTQPSEKKIFIPYPNETCQKKLTLTDPSESVQAGRVGVSNGLRSKESEAGTVPKVIF